MDLTWNLDELYCSFETDEFKNDLGKLTRLIDEIKEWSVVNLGNSAKHEQTVKKIEEYLHRTEQYSQVFAKLYNYCELTISVEAQNELALQLMEQIKAKITELAAPETRFAKWLGSFGNLEELIQSSGYLSEHRFYLMEIAQKSNYLLSESEETLLAKMKNTGSEAWKNLQQVLTSTLTAQFPFAGTEQPRELPISIIRSFAYEKDAAKRKTAYESELKAYTQIEAASAACLNGIKGEVLTETKLRGYKTPLDEAIINNRIDLETLEAMFEAVKTSLPEFHKYYLKKAELLGKNNGLPFYDLFAPLGELEHSQFTYEEARNFLVTHFKSFSTRLASMTEKAFDNRWIDAAPRKGKCGGAFCMHLYTIKQSRILCNFTGNYDDIFTIAHELGHAYHNECLNQEIYLNSAHPMSIAETASLFCETIVKKAAFNQAILKQKSAGEERASTLEGLAILEKDICASGQIVVDIYSRFLFEKKLFEKRQTASLSVAELKELMLAVQLKAYGTALDPEFLHPYMWLIKPHYYDAAQNFYNFPYTFGLLFSKGLYSEYLKKGTAFVEEFEHLLSVSGKYALIEIAAQVGIDIHDVNFWRSSLQVIKEDIAKFLALSSSNYIHRGVC